MLGCDNAVVEAVDWHRDPGGQLEVITHVRPKARQAGRCGICGRPRPGYDQGSGRRRRRALDLGTVTAWLEADCPRVACPEHGVVTAAVPWARHGAGHTRFFDDQVAWLAAACSKTTLTQLMRVSWRTVGNIVERVCAGQLAATDPLDGLTRIGIDEISYKRGHRYLVVVVDHQTGRLVWAAPGRDTATVARFFDALGEQRSAQLTHVSADGASWISDVVAARAPQAVLCADPFYGDLRVMPILTLPGLLSALPAHPEAGIITRLGGRPAGCRRRVCSGRDRCRWERSGRARPA